MSVPSEIVGYRTWWLDELIIHDLACCEVDDADSSQRLAIRGQALRALIWSAHDNMYATTTRVISQLIA
jgi:hypothetical protein